MARMTHTVLGSRGFIGNRLKVFLERTGVNVFAPVARTGSSLLDEVLGRELGHVFYCIGLTADFRERPFDTVDAHVCLLRALLENGRFATLTYLSSTRVYAGARSTDEDGALQTEPANPSHLYNLSKLMGESLCFSSGRCAKVARLSNVYGHDSSSNNFLDSVLHDAAHAGEVTFQSAPDSAKDYVFVEDVIHWLPRIATEGKSALYNVASGKNVTNDQIGAALTAAGIRVSFASGAPTISFPVIKTTRLFEEFGPPQHDLTGDLPRILTRLRAHCT